MIPIVASTKAFGHGSVDMEVWNKPRPKSLGKPKPLTPDQKTKAKAAAKKAGRSYPNLVDNMRVSKGKTK